ncbi:MAG: MBL fold metallo-hydrolase [Rhodothermia bacterium]|nr:MAG: MBL fold metallo-hydrolase [Rhodothermia bacterium]
MPKIGQYSVHTIETGRLGLDGGAMFGIVPKALWERRIPSDRLNRISLHMRCLLLESSDRLILIDNGLGDKYSARFSELYAIDDSEMNLPGALQSAGFSFEDVTDVILTHLHFDHCGGSTRRHEDRLEVSFPNAQYLVQKGHWEWANVSNVREKASFLAENLDPLAESGQLTLIEGQQELFPGVEVIPVDGHTREMQIVKISDAEHTLVFVADLLPTHAHLSPAWNMSYDLWPMTTIDEKEKFLTDAVDGGWHLFFEHDPEITVADVEVTERGLKVANPRPLDEL